jgi:peptide/nickel transport system substrate-binding protein
MGHVLERQPSRHETGRRTGFGPKVATVFAALFIAAACSPAPSVAPGASGPAATSGATGPTETQTGEVLPAPGSTLTVCVSSLGAQDWTPWLSGNEEEIITREVGDVLIEVDEQGHLLPAIATEWTLEPDLSAWHFKIRDDVPFQGGYGNVTAEDVKFSFEQYLHADSNQSISNFISRAVQGDISNFEVVSPTEFTLHMDPKDPVIYLDAVLSKATPGLPINSKKYYDEKGDAAFAKPLGTGPYEFVSSEPGVQVTLKAVPNHWRETAYYETVVYKIVADEAARLSQLKTGDCDLGDLSPALLAEAEAAGVKAQTIKDVGSANVVMGGNYYSKPDKIDCDAAWVQCDAPEKAIAIREALSLAIDRKSILDTIFGGHGTLTHAGAFEFPDTQPETVDPAWTLPEFNVEKAKQKLAEGGFPDGFPITMWIYEDLPGSTEAGQAIAQMWGDIGIDVTQEIVEYRLVVREAMRNQTTQGHAFMRISSNYPETVHSVLVGHTSNSTTQAYNSKVVDDYYALMAVEPDKVKRESLALELMNKMRDEWTMLPMFTLDSTWGSSDKVGSWSPVAGYPRPTNVEGIRP